MSKPLKFALDLVGGKLTKSAYSHKAGWAYLRANQLKHAGYGDITVLHGESWDDYDGIFLYHSMEFAGSLNLFGGAAEESAKFYERLIKYDGQLISLDIDMPDYGELCKGRLKACDDYWRNVDWDAVSAKCKNIVALHKPESTNHLVIGDSHSFSVYIPGAMTLRKDGRTLAGVLKKTIAKEIGDQGFNLSEIEELTCYWGNIDIRHHLLRHPDPISALTDILNDYEMQLTFLNKEIELVWPLPIEDESRRLPKTGYFEGTPFFGSREERQLLVELMIVRLEKMAVEHGWKIYRWPTEWYQADGKEFMQTFMERPKSVHLAPLYHRWNCREDRLNDFSQIVENTPNKIINTSSAILSW